MSAPEQARAQGKMMTFRRRSAREPTLDKEQAARQGEITRLALLVLGPERAIAFLNGENADIGGRPLDLAIASAEGRDAVETALGRLAYHPIKQP